MVVRQRSSILRQALILINQPSNALTAIRLIPPIWISHNFKATTLGMTRKTMRNRGFEPWTFRSCLGYQHFVINDNNRDQWKKDSKKTSIATVAEIKTEANVAEKASTLVAATDHGDRFHPLDLPHKKLFPQPMDIQTRQTIGCGIKRGKLYYLDLQSKDSNKLQQALMADGSEGEKKMSEIWLWHRRLGHASFEVVRASLIASKTPISYWGEAITSAAYLINRVPSSSINFQTPLQALTNVVVAPTVPNLPPGVFGCVAFVASTQTPTHQVNFPCITMCVVDMHCTKRDIDVTILQLDKLNQEAGELDMSGQQFGSEDVFTEIPNQSSSVEGVLNLEPNPFMKRLPHRHNRAIPNSVQEALADPRWKAAMNEEMKSLQKNETWELVECPPGNKPVGCRWIYTVKYKADGSIERFKARLVAKGYTQTYGIDYTETFAPVTKINTVRVLLSLAANLDWPLQQFNVKNVFLHGELSEEVYMDLPLDAWFTKSMRAFDYRQSNSDHTLFLKNQHGKITALIVYVDDMVVTGNDPEERKALQNYLYREFEMKDLGPLKYFMGLKFLDQVKEFFCLKEIDDRRSTSGYFTFVGGNLVTWKSKKQNVVARSSAEVEFRACRVDRFFIKEKLDDKIVELPKIRSEDQLVDILTKAVSSQVFSKFLDKLACVTSMHQLEGEC
ncbi:Retrovirus-related Pol polyprotein from transposon TNT 1-94 [Vitis vinifera]|uniref:Retrovirus-related Pol polyprotein from transposon TNT 1-94 n=1 Tax=Vitis vinifera TaxID=29760 RepID=A0A438GWJ2_VITVI|nr:Retrovirus-related Pol polyprotein from transposon TNT 1-94 [Vitis vinifera]